MASVNKVILVGHLGRDAEARPIGADGRMAARLSVATTHSWKGNDGQKREETEWHRVSCFGATAKVAAELFKKGKQVYVEGRLQTRKWQDKDGKDRHTTEIIADTIQLLGSAPKSSASPQETPVAAQAPAAFMKKAPEGEQPMEDDIPF